MTANTQQTKRDAREQRILDVTAELLVRYGYDKTSVSDIAKGAGISKGAIYLHFDSKDELIYKLMMRETLWFVDEWAEKMKSDTSKAVFASMYKHVLTIIQQNDFLWTLFSKQRWLLGAEFFYRQNTDALQQRFGLSKTMLTRLKEVGAIRQDIDPDVIAYIFSMLNFGYVRLADVIPVEMQPPADKVIDDIGYLIQHHLQPDGEGNPEAAREVILGFLDGARKIIKHLFEDNPS